MLASADKGRRLPVGAAGVVANKMRATELQAGRPRKKGDQRRPAYAHNVKALRDQELELAQCSAAG